MCFMGFMDMQHLNDKVKFAQTINFIRKVLSVLETTRFKTIKKNQKNCIVNCAHAQIGETFLTLLSTPALQMISI